MLQNNERKMEHDSETSTCENCGHGTKERVLGNGITEPPYLFMIRCPFDKEYYKYMDDCCDQWSEKVRNEKEGRE